MTVLWVEDNGAGRAFRPDGRRSGSNAALKLSKATADPSAARQDDTGCLGNDSGCDGAAGGAQSAVSGEWSPWRNIRVNRITPPA